MSVIAEKAGRNSGTSLLVAVSYPRFFLGFLDGAGTLPPLGGGVRLDGGGIARSVFATFDFLIKLP